MANPFADLAAPAADNPFANLAPATAAGANPFEGEPEDPGSIRPPYSLGEKVGAAVKHPLVSGGKLMSLMTGHAFDEPEVNEVTGAAAPNPLQLVASPLRMVAKGAEVAAGAGASKLAQTFPDMPAGIPATLATAAAMGGDPMMYLPEGEAVKFMGSPSLIAKQAAEGAAAVSKLGKGLGRITGLRKAAAVPLSDLESLPGPEAVSEAMKIALGHDPTETNLKGFAPLTPEELDRLQKVKEGGKVRPELQGAPVAAAPEFKGAEAPANPFADLGELEPGLKATAGPEGTQAPGTSLEGLAREEATPEAAAPQPEALEPPQAVVPEPAQAPSTSSEGLPRAVVTQKAAGLNREALAQFRPAPPAPAPWGFSEEVFQGRGASPEDIYGPEAVAEGRAVPLAGKGQYYAFNADDAANYGPNVSRAKVNLKNPLVVQSNKDWFDLLQKADAEHLNSGGPKFYQDPAGIAPATERLKAYVLGQGHDGIVIKGTAENKRLRESFGHDQVVSYAEPKAAAAGTVAPQAETIAPVPETKAPEVEAAAPAAEPPAPKKRFLQEYLDQPEVPVEVGSPTAQGKESIIQAGPASYRTRYKVVSAEDLIPSHDPYTFSPNPKYPERVQERNYDTDKFSQRNVVDIASKLNPANVLSDTPLATDGPPVVTPGGLVMGGNNRAMSIARAITDNPDRYAAYKSELAARAANLGISPEELAAAGEHPVLIREMQDAPAGRQELAQVSRNLNEDLTKGKDPAAEAVSLGRAISGETIEKIRELMADPETTLAEALSSQKAAKELVPLLTKDGVMAATKMNEFLTAAGNFTERGAQLVQDALLGNVLQDRNLVAELPGKAKQGILKIIPDLVRSRASGPEWDLTGALREAAEIITQAKQSGMRPGSRLAQTDFFQVRTPESEAIARLLDGKIGPLRDAFAKWLDLAPRVVDYDPAQVSLLDMDAVKAPVGLDARQAFHEAFSVPDLKANPVNPKVGEGGVKLYSFPGPVVDHAMQLLSRTLRAYAKGHLAPVDEMATAAGIVERDMAGKVSAIEESGKTFNEIQKLQLSNGELDGVRRLRRFFDPNYISPRLAEEVSNVTDRYFDAKGKYLDQVGAIYKDAKLTKEEGQVVAMALDAHASLVDPRLEMAKNQYRTLLNKVADLMKLPRNLRLSDYWPHIMDHETAKAFRESGIVNLGEDGKAAPLVKATVNVHQLHRFKDFTVAPKYSYDLLPVLETYVNTCLKKAFFNPFVDNYTKAGAKGTMELAKEGPWFQKYVGNYLAQLQGRPTAMREYFQEMFGEIEKTSGVAQKLGVDKYTADRLQRNISRAYYRSLLGLAIDTSMKNLFQIVNTTSEAGFINTGKGILKLMTPDGRKQFEDAKILDQYAKTMEGQAELLSASNIMKHVDAVIFTPMRFSEYVNRGVAFHAGMAEGLAKGIRDGGELTRYARYVVDKTQFRYGIANTSPYMNNPLSKLAYQFSTYPTKEYQFIRQLMKDPDKAKITRLLALHGMMVGGTVFGGVNLMNAMGWERAGDMAIVGGYVPKDLKNVPLPTQFFSTIAGMRSPALQLALGLATGPKGRQLYGNPFKNLAMLGAGAVGVPLRTLNKVTTMLDEMDGPGYERKGGTSVSQALDLKKKGEYTRRTSGGDALLKFLGGAEPRRY